MIIFAEGYWYDNYIIAFRVLLPGKEEYWFNAEDVLRGETRAMAYRDGNPKKPCGFRDVPEILQQEIPHEIERKMWEKSGYKL